MYILNKPRIYAQCPLCFVTHLPTTCPGEQPVVVDQTKIRHCPGCFLSHMPADCITHKAEKAINDIARVNRNIKHMTDEDKRGRRMVHDLKTRWLPPDLVQRQRQMYEHWVRFKAHIHDEVIFETCEPGEKGAIKLTDVLKANYAELESRAHAQRMLDMFGEKYPEADQYFADLGKAILEPKEGYTIIQEAVEQRLAKRLRQQAKIERFGRIPLNFGMGPDDLLQPRRKYNEEVRKALGDITIDTETVGIEPEVSPATCRYCRADAVDTKAAESFKDDGPITRTTQASTCRNCNRTQDQHYPNGCDPGPSPARRFEPKTCASCEHARHNSGECTQCECVVGLIRNEHVPKPVLKKPFEHTLTLDYPTVYQPGQSNLSFSVIPGRLFRAEETTIEVADPTKVFIEAITVGNRPQMREAFQGARLSVASFMRFWNMKVMDTCQETLAIDFRLSFECCTKVKIVIKGKTV